MKIYVHLWYYLAPFFLLTYSTEQSPSW
jgi:hypothetical protein